MKKIIIASLVLILLSCSSDDVNTPTPQVNQEYLDQLLGWYELKAIYTNEPIDLNGDGISGTDVFEEVEYCNFSVLLDSYHGMIVSRGTPDSYNYQRIGFDAPASDWSNVEQSYTHCLKHENLSSDIIIDSMNESVVLDTLDYQLEHMHENRTKILDFRWEDRIMYLTLEQQLMTPSDEWKTVTMNLEYEWVHSET